MYRIDRVPASADLASATRRLLDSLPEWFGIAEANDSYVESATRLPGYLAVRDGEIAGLLLVNRHFAESAEVHLIAVAPQRHRDGAGRALVAAAEDDLRADGCQLLQVKTLGPSRPDAGYAKTRLFYLSVGFLPLEETLELWDENPCLIMVKPLLSEPLDPAR
ncbi:MAG TPA: GNAT family N-acetyltransferase [Micromonosporaceae bacterium]